MAGVMAADQSRLGADAAVRGVPIIAIVHNNGIARNNGARTGAFGHPPCVLAALEVIPKNFARSFVSVRSSAVNHSVFSVTA